MIHTAHLSTVQSHDEAVTYLEALSRGELVLLAKSLDLRHNTTKAMMVLRITSCTVDCRVRSAAIRNIHM